MEGHEEKERRKRGLGGEMDLSQHRNEERIPQSCPPSKPSDASRLGIWPDVQKSGHCKTSPGEEVVRVSSLDASFNKNSVELSEKGAPRALHVDLKIGFLKISWRKESI